MGNCPAAQATLRPLYGNLAGTTSSDFPHASRVSCSERLCENPKIANRVPTGGRDRAPAKHSGPTSVSIRASPKGQVPTGPTFHTVWRGVGRRFGANYSDHAPAGLHHHREHFIRDHPYKEFICQPQGLQKERRSESSMPSSPST